MKPDQPIAAPVVYCRFAATAPRDCGQVQTQVLRDAQGQVVGRWMCTFCAEQGARGAKQPEGERDGKR